jgi:cell division GTPase FtsZ
VLGYGSSQLPLLRLPGERTRDFRKKGSETQKGVMAMDAAISELSLYCNPEDARRALYLISAPSRDMNVDLVKDLGDYLRSIAPHAIIRNGDYPRQRGVLDVSVILSELSNVEKIRGYYTKSTTLIPAMKRREQETEDKLRELEDSSIEVPSLV